MNGGEKRKPMGKHKQRTIKQMLTFISRTTPIPRETLKKCQAPIINCFGELKLAKNKEIKREDMDNGGSQAKSNSTEIQTVKLKKSTRAEPENILKRIQGSHLTQPTEEEREQASV